MRIWSWLCKAVPILVITTMLASAISVAPQLWLRPLNWHSAKTTNYHNFRKQLYSGYNSNSPE